MRCFVGAAVLTMAIAGCSRADLSSSGSLADTASKASTQEDRAALFDWIVETTMDREAFSAVKEVRLKLDIVHAMSSVRREFIEAASDEELFYAITRLSNSRKDQHLSVRPLSGGLWPASWGPTPDPWEAPAKLESPIRFAVDYGTSGSPWIFVGDVALRDSAAVGMAEVAVGDKLVSVQNLPVDEYISLAEPYTRYSTESGFWWKLAEQLSTKEYSFPAQLRADSARFTLERPSGRRYSVSLAYQEPRSIVWSRSDTPVYSDFQILRGWDSFDLYVHTTLPVVLFDWSGFEESLISDVDSLMEVARDNSLLDHSVIIDATRSGGGARGAYALQRLVAKPFRTTFGNLRLSDLTPEFVAQKRKEIEVDSIRRHHPRSMDRGSWLLEWLSRDVEPGFLEAREFSRAVPFKLVHAPMDSDGVVQPAPVHFRGELVLLLSPYGGSHLDQFAAMVIDNNLGLTLGMPTAGYSNSWGWRELLIFPHNKQAVAYFSWSIGHSIRPNGQVLEGNPPGVTVYIPQTRENFANYRDLLVRRAVASLADGL